MPIYDYRCTACDERFEQLVASDEDRDAIACPQCQSPRAERLLARFAGHSKGGAVAQSSGGAHSCGSPSCCRVPR